MCHPDIRDRSRFFVQVGHKFFFTILRHRQTYQNYQQPLRNGILLQKLFLNKKKKNCSSDREKLLKEERRVRKL